MREQVLADLPDRLRPLHGHKDYALVASSMDAYIVGYNLARCVTLAELQAVHFNELPNQTIKTCVSTHI